MPFTDRPPSHRPLSDALDYIEVGDGCTRAEAFEQFRQMVISKEHHPFRLQCLWGDRQPDLPANIGPVTAPTENIGPYPPDWEGATLETDGHVRFSVLAEPRPILVPWNDFLVAWGSHQPRADPAEAYVQEQAARMRAARLEREAYDRRWRQKCAEECTGPIQERQYFSFAEIAHKLACDPHTLLVDPELAERIVGELAERVMKGHFAATEVAGLCGDPPDFQPVQLSPGDYLVPDGEALFLTRAACRRYIEARTELPGGPGLIRDWFVAGALHAAPRDGHCTTAPVTRPPSRLAPFWTEAEAMITEWLQDNGYPQPGDAKQAELERWTAELLDKRGWTAGEATIRRHVRECIKRYRAANGA